MILANDFKKQWAEVGHDIHAAVENVAFSGHYILGENVQRFEKNFAEYCGLQHCVGVANGLDAIEIALKVLECKDGEAVLTTPLSAFATTLAIIRAGGRPIFCDVDETGLIDLDLAEKLIEKNLIKYFVPVHLFGHSLNMTKLKKIKEKFSIKIIEDCAQAVGAKYSEIPIGTVGDICTFSFYPTKKSWCFGRCRSSSYK